jgi:transposase
MPIERNSEDKINQRAIYASNIVLHPIENLIFLDETGINKHLTKHYGYSPKSVKGIKPVPANRGLNLSCMCAIFKEGLIAYEIRRGSYNSEFFVEFIQNKLADFFRNNPQKILIMDNARFHHLEIVLLKLRELGIAFKFLPPYSPQLNPIEEFFSMIKSRFTSIHDSTDVIENDFRTNFEGFYEHMSEWVEKARQRIDF